MTSSSNSGFRGHNIVEACREHLTVSHGLSIRHLKRWWRILRMTIRQPPLEDHICPRRVNGRRRGNPHCIRVKQASTGCGQSPPAAFSTAEL